MTGWHGTSLAGERSQERKDGVVLPISEVRRIARAGSVDGRTSSAHAPNGISAMAARSVKKTALLMGRWLA
jgi:hypothetical protein